jgi:hypothetical protein
MILILTPMETHKSWLLAFTHLKGGSVGWEPTRLGVGATLLGRGNLPGFGVPFCATLLLGDLKVTKAEPA